MKDRNTLVFVALAFLLAIGIASSATQTWKPAAKAAVQFSDVTLIDWQVLKAMAGEDKSETPIDSQRILWTGLKTGSKKDLLVGVSTECGLYTFTNVKSKGGNWDTSTAEATVQIQVFVDGKEAEPEGPVTFCRRKQELSAKFQGILEIINPEQCLDDGPDEIPGTADDFYDVQCLANMCLELNAEGNLVIADECLTEEELNLTLDTMNANHFNFVAADVGSGFHTVEVNATINLGAEAQKGQGEAKALIGRGILTVEEIQLVKDQIDLTFFLKIILLHLVITILVGGFAWNKVTSAQKHFKPKLFTRFHEMLSRGLRWNG
jgi:hypothetical protein